VAWQKGIDLVADIYRATEKFPKHEIYGLTNQLRRAAVSVPSNIAEGQAHYSNPEFKHYLRHARGSLAEIETQVLIAERLKYLSGEQASTLQRAVSELNRILAGLLSSIEKKLGARYSVLGTHA
jgi:four helix bundle protein